MTAKRTRLVALGLGVLVAGCPGNGGEPSFGPMYEDVERWVWNNGYEAGVWAPDWDDAPFYGPAFYARVGWEEGRSDYQGRALEAVEHNLEAARAGIADPLGELVDNVAAIVFGTLGVIDYMAASGDMEPLEVVDRVTDLIDGVLSLMGDYAEGYESYATTTYGPTSITAVFTLLHLQHALLLETDRRDERVARAREIVDNVHALAWNGSFYQFDRQQVDELYLYPNVAMMIALARVYQATGDRVYLERAEDAFDGIDPLACPDRPGYRSPYSAEAMGAMTEDYSTLSSHNYAMLAFLLLEQITGDTRYGEARADVMRLVEDYLWVPGDGRVYHHWMDGRLAVPEDPEYFCIGCNLQLLYVVRYRPEWSHR